MKGNKMETITINKIDRSLFVEARLWFDKTYGNTYYSARLYVDGEIIATLPMSYGYDMQYLQGARDKLIELGYISAEYASKPLWRAVSALGIDLYFSDKYVTKRELFKAE